MKLLLHSCCAPCSIQCVKALRNEGLRGEGIEPTLFWYNPNIHPYTEYSARRDCLKSFATDENLELTLVDEYGLRSFLNIIFQKELSQRREDHKDAKEEFGNDFSWRCEECYTMRLEKTALFAAENGFSAFSTTLLISPYQDHEALKRVGEQAGVKHGVDFLYRDFRPFFREGQAAARSAGFYMQKYCGCVFSEEERINSRRSHAKALRKIIKKISHEDTEEI